MKRFVACLLICLLVLMGCAGLGLRKSDSVPYPFDKVKAIAMQAKPDEDGNYVIILKQFGIMVGYFPSQGGNVAIVCVGEQSGAYYDAKDKKMYAGKLVSDGLDAIEGVPDRLIIKFVEEHLKAFGSKEFKKDNI